MTCLRRVALSLAFAFALAAPVLVASYPANATGGGCINLTYWGVGVTEGMAATKARWLVSAKRSAWTAVKGPRSYVDVGPMSCYRTLLVYTCKLPVHACK